ncbi:MAG: GAF domain-containing protein [Bacteroidota bacterium]
MKKVRFSIGGKILGGFLTLIVLFAINAGISIVTLNSGISLTERTTEVTNPSADAIVNFLSMVSESEKLITSWVYLQNNEDNKQALKDLHTEYPQQKEVLLQLSSAWDDSIQTKELDTVFTQFEALIGAEQEIMTSLVSFEDYEDPMAKLMAESMIEDEVIPRTKEIRQQLTEISSIKEQEAEQAQTENIASYLQLRQVILILGAMTVVLGLIGAFWISGLITRPIAYLKKIILELGEGRLPEEDAQKSYKFSNDEVGEMADAVDGLVKGLQGTSEFAENIGKGEYNAEFTPLSDEDILGNALINMRDNLRKVAEEDKVRSWATEGTAQFGELLRQNNSDMKQLTQTILSHLISYLHANQGGLYLVQGEKEDEPFMALEACYAWDREKYLDQKIYKGEGLAGQSWQEQDTIYLTDVPDDYVTIASGLGEANPTSIVIVPLLINEEVYGVIELASFEEFKPYEIEFLQKIAESIASTVSTVKINARTQNLLAESQEMTEQMQAQEEEMRQNMEELQATQEEMERGSSEMKSRIEAVDHSGIARIEFKMDGTIVDANAAFLSLMKYDLDDIRGKHHRIFVTSDYAKSDEYQQFWDDLNAGQLQVGKYERVAKDGSKRYIQGYYSTVKDKSDQPVRVIKFATDITELMADPPKDQKKQLQAQKEEMQQVMQELEAVREELSLKQQELEAAINQPKSKKTKS